MAENKGGRTYKATGITLKSVPMGESDRLLTILTKEHGLVRAITPGARKPKSSLRAISTGFVMGDLFIVKGRTLDKLVQADCRASFPGLSRDLGKLTAAQYLAELALGQALSEHPQDELFDALTLHLNHIAQRPPNQTLPSLVQGILHFLALAGIAPQVAQCCVTQVPIQPNLADPNWRVGFDASAGGAISLKDGGINTPTSSAPASITYGAEQSGKRETLTWPNNTPIVNVAEPFSSYRVHPIDEYPSLADPIRHNPIPKPILKKEPKKTSVRQVQLDATELTLLQYLSQPDHPIDQQTHRNAAPPMVMPGQADLTGAALEQDREEFTIPNRVWLSLERTLRYYAQYHFDQPIRSAALIETCFLKTMTG